MFRSKRLVEALLTEAAVNAELRARIATLQAHFDWLAQHVNELKVERAALLERCLGIQLAAIPSIERSEPASLPGADVAYTPTPPMKTPRIGDILAQARELVDDRRRPAPSVADAQVGGIEFEDMGDDRAAAEGITHATDGTVVHSR